MGRERQTLTVEHISKGIRYRRMVKGKVWTSQVYDSDTRQNKQEAWESFKLWREHRTCQVQKSTASVHTLSPRPLPELAPDILNALHAVPNDPKGSGLEAIIPNLSLLALEQIGRILHQHFSGSDTVLNNLQRNIIDSIGSSTKSQPTVGELADQLINLYMVKAKSGDISIGRYGDVKYGLNYFLDWFDRSTPVTEIAEATVSGFYQFQLSRITEGANRNSCSKHMAIFNLFVDFCAQEVAAFKKPNNLRSRQYQLSQAGSDVAVFTNHEVSLLLGTCNSRMKLYMLLMLNCAMYQGDVASITADDVDWENGRIIVARSKKEKLSNGPTVKCNWILWDETWKLLQELGNRDGLVLTNVNGKPLLNRTSTGPE